VGFLDALLGGRGKRVKGAAPDRLFAMATAQVTLDTGLGLKHKGAAGIVFQPLQTADFESILSETDELLRDSAADTGTKVDSTSDEYGYRWITLHDSDFEDLVVAMNTVSSQMVGSGYGDRLLAAVFPFEDKGRTVYFIYNFKRGGYYPFIPAPGDQARDSEGELRLKAQVGGELPWEEEISRWFPLWEIPV
jgi:PspAB-like protein